MWKPMHWVILSSNKRRLSQRLTTQVAINLKCLVLYKEERKLQVSQLELAKEENHCSFSNSCNSSSDQLSELVSMKTVICITLLLCSVIQIVWGNTRHNRVWPIRAQTSVDLPQSSPHGPRLLSSSNYRWVCMLIICLDNAYSIIMVLLILLFTHVDMTFTVVLIFAHLRELPSTPLMME